MSTIAVDENISVKQVAQFHDQLKEEAQKDDTITLDFSSVRRVDLAVIQLLISFQQYMKENKKAMKLKNVSEEMKEQLKITGLAK
jgi:anti-anti-sigma factor